VNVVLDTNILVAGLRSRTGASFEVLRRLGDGCFTPVISPPLCIEYEDVLLRPGMVPTLTPSEISAFLDYILSVSTECRVYYLWRPHVRDPKDDLVLEVALAGRASHIVTLNGRDFASASSMGISIVTPGEFLRMLPPV
jgi:putative PIN family toxin of toxin-antitoxin system